MPEIAHMEPERFIEEVLVGQLKMKFAAVGTDFHFGYQRRGDHAMLQKLAPKYGYTVEVVEKNKATAEISAVPISGKPFMTVM